LGGQHLDQVLRQAERLTDVSDRAFGAIADHGRAEGRVGAAVLLEDPLHNNLAPLMLEIDVDVWRLVAFLRHEALEHQIIPRRIDRCDAEYVADGAVRRAATALAKDVPRSCEADDRMNGQEVWRVFQLLDQP